MKNEKNYEHKSTIKEALVKGRVSQVQRDAYKVLCEYGEIDAKLKGSFYKDKNNSIYPVVGDYVFIKYNEIGSSLIQEVCERKSCFSRTDFSGHAAGYVKTVKEQVIASNFDYVFILSSLNMDFSLNRITRYISVALESGAKPIVILSKADLSSNIDEYIDEIKAISDKIEVIAISAKTGYGMEYLNKYIEPDKTIVILGSSGVGKSTLVNAISGKVIMHVSDIREDDSKGRHTTTHRELIVLPSGAILIDTPGIRELGMWNVENGINNTFEDITDLFNKCKYSNCTHMKEPHCAVNKAIETGSLSKERWKAYCQLLNENQWAKKKAKNLRSIK